MTLPDLDSKQREAATAPGGIVQIIAPAGSGKTTVLVERVRQLLTRGAAAERILALTFNDAAAAELRERLRRAGIASVQARTFHSIGHRIIRAHGLVEGRTLHSEGWSLAQWNRFARIAADELGVAPPDPAELADEIATIRLTRLVGPKEYERTDPGVLARVYALVEREKDRRRLYDFDDMIVHAVRLLRRDEQARARWQATFDHVLVDEYQDIEPAQERLVRLLAAPQDDLFVVGDEDQTLYGWRRASVTRMLELDAAHRIQLEHNYRCRAEVVEASAKLIAHNRERFDKRIRPVREPGGDRAIRVHAGADGPALLARKLAAHRRGEIAVLARTINALRPYALAAAAGGVPLTGPAELFAAAGAQGTLEAYFAVLAGEPADDDVRIVLRRPSRGLGADAPERVAAAVRRGATLSQAVLGLAGDWRTDKAADQFRALEKTRDAGALIARLRQDGLEKHFAASRADRDDLGVLDEAQREAAGHTPAEHAQLLAHRRQALRRARHDGGIELTTVHRAKGRQGPKAVVVGVAEGVPPRHHGGGVEAERRIAYVAFTRAQEELSLLHSPGRASRFLHEAGLVETHQRHDLAQVGLQNALIANPR